MQITSSAKCYADALIQIGDVSKDLEIVREIFAQSPDLTAVLENPAIPEDVKNSIIDSIFSGQVDEKIVNFLKILINKKRIQEFDVITAAYAAELDEKNNIKRVEIVSAVELNEDTRKRITEKLESRLQKTVIPQWQTDSAIIGGLVVKIGDDVIDTSLKNKLERVKKSIT
jgi:F-type H+-transporting ATPase subunit delta